MKLVEEQAKEKREKILEAVRRSIAEKGVAEITIRDLAQDCRVSVPTLYRGFGSKEQLLVEAISSFFNSEVLGDQLDNAGVTGAQRLLAVIDLCGKTIHDMPEYNRQLFTLFMTSEFGAQLGCDITESITGYVRQGLCEIEQAGELLEWADKDVLAERFAAQCVVTVLEFTGGDLSIDGFLAAFGYSAAIMMVAVTTGQASDVFEKRVKETQGNARRQYNARLNRMPGQLSDMGG